MPPCSVCTLASVASRLGMVSIAEGVEDQQDADAMAAIGVDCIQGFFTGRPVAVGPTPQAG